MRGPAKRQLDQALDAAGEALTFSELVDGVLEPVRRGMASSGALLYRYDASGVLDAVGGSLVGGMSRYVAELFPLDPIQQALLQRGVMPEAVVPRRFPELDWGAYRRGVAYNEFYRVHGIENMLGLTLSDLRYGAPLMCGLLLTRSHREAEFDADASSLMTRLRPHLCAAVRRIERYAESERTRSVLEAALESVAERPVVIVEASGRLVHVSSEASAWLDDKGLSCLSSLALRAVASDADRTMAMPGKGSRTLCATAVLARGRSDTLVIISLADASELAPPVQPAHERCGLTPAERDVLRLLAEGLSNREIAQRLFVSVETVRTHVHRVLSKLGVRSRTQAAVMVRGR
jgi:DNA-binding CsgD family transcriptional regulator